MLDLLRAPPSSAACASGAARRKRARCAAARAAGGGPRARRSGRARPRRAPFVLGVGAAAAALLGAWQLVRLLSPVTPHDWLLLAAALGATFLRTLGALALAVAWTLPVGILVGRSPAWSRRLQPVVQIVASFPAPMIFPIVTGALLALHVPFAVIAAVLMLLGAQWYVLFNVLAGASAVPRT